MMNMLLQQIKMRNPQMFKMLEQARKSNNNPVDMLKEVTKNYNERAKQFGVSDEILEQTKREVENK